MRTPWSYGEKREPGKAHPVVSLGRNVEPEFTCSRCGLGALCGLYIETEGDPDIRCLVCIADEYTNENWV